MAKIKTTDGEEAELPDGELMMETCEELGVPIGCSTGTCGVCSIDIEEGEENLSELTESEIEFGSSMNLDVIPLHHLSGSTVCRFSLIVRAIRKATKVIISNVFMALLCAH